MKSPGVHSVLHESIFQPLMRVASTENLAENSNGTRDAIKWRMCDGSSEEDEDDDDDDEEDENKEVDEEGEVKVDALEPVPVAAPQQNSSIFEAILFGIVSLPPTPLFIFINSVLLHFHASEVIDMVVVVEGSIRQYMSFLIRWPRSHTRSL